MAIKLSGDVARHLVADLSFPLEFKRPTANLGVAHMAGSAGIAGGGRPSGQHKNDGEGEASAHALPYFVHDGGSSVRHVSALRQWQRRLRKFRT